MEYISIFDEIELYRNTCFTNKIIKDALCSYYKDINANDVRDRKCDIFYLQEQRLFEINAFYNINTILKCVKNDNKTEEYNYGGFDMYIRDTSPIKVIWYEYTKTLLVYVLVFRNNKNRYNVHKYIDRNSLTINSLPTRNSLRNQKLIEKNIELVNQINEKDLIAYYITHMKLIHKCAIFKSSCENTNDIKLQLICLKSTSNDTYYKLLKCIKKLNEYTNYKYGQFNLNVGDTPKDILSCFSQKTVTKEPMKVLWYEYNEINKYILVFNTDEELNKVHEYVNRTLLNTMSEKYKSKKLSHFLCNLLEKELFMYYCNGEDNDLHKRKCAFFHFNENLKLVCVDNPVTDYSTLLKSIRKQNKDTEYEFGQFDLHITQRKKAMKVLWYRYEGYFDCIFVFRINKNRDNACKFLTKKSL